MSLETKVGTLLRGIAVVSSLYATGCGTTIYTQREGRWHDCNTNEDYPQGHPCYAEVENYKARMAASSSGKPDRNYVDRDVRGNLREKSDNPSKGPCDRHRR